jgi:hypothetical protein
MLQNAKRIIVARGFQKSIPYIPRFVVIPEIELPELIKNQPSMFITMIIWEGSD